MLIIPRSIPPRIPQALKNNFDNIAQPLHTNTMKQFPNYAGRSDVDEEVSNELKLAGIAVNSFEICRESNGEVKTSVFGNLEGWIFKRAWRYWIAQGPGIPPQYANELYLSHGKECRVDGHASGLSPLELMKGFAVGNYHIDSQVALNALSQMIQRIRLES